MSVLGLTLESTTLRSEEKHPLVPLNKGAFQYLPLKFESHSLAPGCRGY